MRRNVRFCLITSLVLAHLCVAGAVLGVEGGRCEQKGSGYGKTRDVSDQRRAETTQDYNNRIEELLHAEAESAADLAQDYHIGPDDLLEVSVFEAPDLNRTVRVSAGGEVPLPLLGNVRAAGRTPSGLASVLEELLRKSYMKDPHVAVFLKEMQSHPVSIFGAVAKPGVYQIRGAKTLIEVLSMAQGLATDAGDTVIVERQENESAEPSEEDSSAPMPAAFRAVTQCAIEIQLKELIDSGNPSDNILVYPGDVVKVTRADVVYVVGEVRKPGGFQLNTNENISVLQALALAEGLTRTSAANRSKVIRTNKATGQRTEITIDIKRILAGKAGDQLLHPNDIIFIPNSAGRAAFYRGAEAAVGIGSSLIVYRLP